MIKISTLQGTHFASGQILQKTDQYRLESDCILSRPVPRSAVLLPFFGQHPPGSGNHFSPLLISNIFHPLQVFHPLNTQVGQARINWFYFLWYQGIEIIGNYAIESFYSLTWTAYYWVVCAILVGSSGSFGSAIKYFRFYSSCNGVYKRNTRTP